ncbi:MAG TPA: TetR/AcrR family transcriptional regulator [Pseudonocardia sp.]|jgi:AcrR family transcriptional regulator
MASDGFGPQARSRRTRDRILNAAWDAFTSEGFDRASTKRIAAAAGVNSSLIFRYFGSKDGLYQEAVLEPLQRQLAAFVQTWDSYGRAPHPATRTATDFLGGLYDLFRSSPEVAQALMSVGSAGDHERAREFSARFEHLLSRVDDVVDAEARERGWSAYNTRLTTRITFGIAFSFAVLGDLLFPPASPQPSRDDLVNGMAAYVLRSISNPGGATPWQADASGQDQ